MPIYEYRCQKCGNQLEVMQKVTDPAPITCPSCQAENSFERLMSRTSFQLKGGGWGNDLYASTKKDVGTATAPTSGGSTATAAAPSAGTSTAPAAAASTSSTSSTAAAPAATTSSTKP